MQPSRFTPPRDYRCARKLSVGFDVDGWRCYRRRLSCLTLTPRSGIYEMGSSLVQRVGEPQDARITNMNSRVLSLVAFLSFMLLASCLHAADYAIGADLSFLKQAEDRGTVFKDGGEAKPGLEIFKDHGYNWIRLRLFHTPTNLNWRAICHRPRGAASLGPSSAVTPVDLRA